MLRYIESFFRNKWLITIPALCLVLCGTALVLLVTPQYAADATIWVERPTYLEIPGKQNVWITPAQAEAGRFRELISTRTFSQAIAARINLPGGTSEVDKAHLTAAIQEGLYVWPEGEYLLSISFPYPESAVTLAVVQAAIDEYTKVMADSANRQAIDAIDFYKERISTYENEILPRSNGAVTEYLSKHPELQQKDPDVVIVDPTFIQLQRQAEIDRDLYARYQQRLDQVMTQSEAVNKNQVANFRVLDAPLITPGTGRLSKKNILVFVAGGAGLALGYVGLFLGVATELDRTIRNPGDVKRQLRLPVLDVIPVYAQEDETAKPKRRRRGKKFVLDQTVPSSG
jgi:capsular polysaccharide biosynthesis protein